MSSRMALLFPSTDRQLPAHHPGPCGLDDRGRGSGEVAGHDHDPLDSLGMPKGELEHRRGACRDADDVELVEPELVEQRGVGVGLIGWCRVRGKGRADVSEPGHSR